MNERSPAPGYGSSRTRVQKLGIYLVGVAIGLMLLGWFQMKRQQAVRAQERAAEATGPLPAPAAVDQTRDGD